MAEPTKFPIVDVTFENHIFRIHRRGDDDPVEYAATERLEGTEIGDLKRQDGNPVGGKNFRALLKCNGGTLSYSGEVFRVLFKLRQSTLGPCGRISNANLPSPDIDAQIPESADSPPRSQEWKVYQNPNDKGDPFFRYVRYGLAACGKCSHVGVGRVEVSYVRPADPSLTHVDHRSSANSAMIVNITGVHESFDGLYRVKLITSEAKFRHEVLANNILARITKHGAFCTHSFAFRCRLIDPDGVNQYAIATKLEDAISLKQAREGDMTLSELEILLGLNFLLEGRISVDTRAQPQGEGIQRQWAHGDLHDRNILIWRKPSGGFRRFAFIDFANSDIIYTEGGVTQRLFGGRGKRKKDGELVTPSGVMETNELVGIFRCLLTSRRYEDSAKFLAELRDSCTLTSVYAAVKMRINEVQNADVQSSAKA